MEERLFAIQKLKRKYGNSIEQILSQQEQLKQQVQMFTHRKEFVEQMDKKDSNSIQPISKKMHRSYPRFDNHVRKNLMMQFLSIYMN